MADGRTNELLAAVDHLLAAWRTWRDDQQAIALTEEFSETIAGCLTLWDEGTVPGELRKLLPNFAELKAEWNRWVEQHDAAPTRHAVPGRTFWSVLESIELAQLGVRQPKTFTLEPIAKLEAMIPPTGDQQICRMYGFTDDGTPSGNPILTMLQEERAKPGRHTGPGTGWEPPHARRQKAIEAKQRAAVEQMQRAAQSKVARLTEPAKETIDDLIVQGVSGKQICRMKKCTRADLAAYCKEHGVTVPEWEPTPANVISGDFDRPGPEIVPMGLPAPNETDLTRAEVVDDIGAMTLEQQIVMYHQSGLAPAAIAEKVSEPDAPITSQKVGKVLARWKADPDAFEMAGV